MIRNRLYYGIKPLVPASVRLAIRRWFARRTRAQVDGVWPIMPGSEAPPRDWPGWPGGKQFALVFTHDVEGQVGLDKVLRLLELEVRLGVRSSFNLIPEGDYKVHKELRDRISGSGFEIGVHDLHHDGKLFRTRKDFNRRAAQINHYLNEWGAVGFRSGFMLHNLDWLHELNIRYDASTFDTDPFEPQPQGRNTIFPFWVPSPTRAPHDGATTSVHEPNNAQHGSPGFASGCSSNGGYVELPYTLPQDSTLYLLLAERHPDIWFQKLDWVAKHGGMVLVDTHPDYMAFNDTPANKKEYPVSFYARLLEYVRTRYEGAYWQALPSEVEKFSRKFLQRAESGKLTHKG